MSTPRRFCQRRPDESKLVHFCPTAQQKFEQRFIPTKRRPLQRGAATAIHETKHIGVWLCTYVSTTINQQLDDLLVLGRNCGH